jgi:hypothetical protein
MQSREPGSRDPGSPGNFLVSESRDQNSRSTGISILIFTSFLKTNVLPIWFHPFIFFTIRWNSMLERFDKVENCILKSLIGSSISFDEEELNMIHNLVTLLEPVKLAVEALCRRDATLYCQPALSVTQRSRL